MLFSAIEVFFYCTVLKVLAGGVGDCSLLPGAGGGAQWPREM